MGKERNAVARSGWITILLLLIIFSICPQLIDSSYAAVSPQVAAGCSHTVALRVDGTVWTWLKTFKSYSQARESA